MQVRVATHALELPYSPLVAPPKEIDWNDSSDRKWLMNHLHHCMMNAKRVVLTPNPNRTHPQGDSNHG
jgi:hypothetical protein